MAGHLRGITIALALLLPCAGLGAQAAVLERVWPIDVDGDGEAELRSVRVVSEHGKRSHPIVLVLVEQRLLTPRAGVADAELAGLSSRLMRFGRDLAAARYCAIVAGVEVQSGPRHQDGLSLLGLRRLLQATAKDRKLAGVVLVGHFPDAMLVRTCNWRRGGAIELPGRDGLEQKFGKDTRRLRRVPEVVAHKCDLVLADLDGNWEQLYLRGPAKLQRVEAVFRDVKGLESGGPCAALSVRHQEFTDVFHVSDGAVRANTKSFLLSIDDTRRDHECSKQDRAAANSIARPELAISRIDARGVAWNPKESFLDANGRPRAVAFAKGSKPPKWDRVWVPDPGLELRLLCEYFDRNHRYRTRGARPIARKPASIAWGLPSGMRSVRQGHASWAGFDEPGYDVVERVDLLQLLAWLQRPALLRTVRAHSSSSDAAFAETDSAELARAVGGVPWSFTREGHSLVPSLHSACHRGRANFFFYRTVWANGVLPGDPYFLIHTGCEALTPPGHEHSYEDPRYGARQHAESMLFYTPCLAIVGRAKVFYDEPRGFSEILRRGGNFGDAWREYFAREAAAESWKKVGGDIGRKRSYFWSLLGDWTLGLSKG